MSKEAQKKQDAKIKQLLIDLNSKDDTVSLKAIKSFKKHGKVQVVEPLLDKLMASKNTAIVEEIESIFNNLKDTLAQDALLEMLQLEKFKPIHQRLLSFIWHSAVNPVDHLDVLVGLAIEGDFHTCLEAYTVIENLEGAVREDLLLESKVLLSSYFAEEPNDDKTELIKSIAERIAAFPEAD